MSLHDMPWAVFHWMATYLDSQSFYQLLPLISKPVQNIMNDPVLHRTQSKSRLCFTDLAWNWFSMNSFTMQNPQMTAVEIMQCLSTNDEFILPVIGSAASKSWLKECMHIYRYQRMITHVMTRHCPNRTLLGQQIHYELPQIFKSLLVDRLTVNLICPIAMNHSDPINRFHLLQPASCPVESRSDIRFPRSYTVIERLHGDSTNADSCDWFQAEEFVWFAGKGLHVSDAQDFSSWCLFIGNQLHETLESRESDQQKGTLFSYDVPIVIDLSECPVVRFNHHPCFGSHLALDALHAQAWLLAGALSNRLSAYEIDRLERWTSSQNIATKVSYPVSRNLASQSDRVSLLDDLKQPKLTQIPESAACLSERERWEHNRDEICQQLSERVPTDVAIEPHNGKKWRNLCDQLYSYEHSFAIANETDDINM